MSCESQSDPIKTHHHEHTHIVQSSSYVPYSNTRMTSRWYYMCDLRQASDPCSRRGFNFSSVKLHRKWGHLQPCLWWQTGFSKRRQDDFMLCFLRQEVRTSPDAFVATTLAFFNETSGRCPDDFWQQSIIFHSGHQDVCCRVYSNKTMIFWWGVRTSPVLLMLTNQMFLKRPQDDFQLWFW